MTHTSQQVHIIRGVIPGGRGRGALPPPPQLFANSNTLTVTISEMHVDLNIIWSHIKSQYCRSTTAPFCTRKVTSPPPQLSGGNYPPENDTYKPTSIHHDTHKTTSTHHDTHKTTVIHTSQQVHTMTYKTTMTHMWQSQVENEH